MPKRRAIWPARAGNRPRPGPGGQQSGPEPAEPQQYAQARNVLENALAQYPDDLHIQISHGQCLAQCGELAAAIDMHARAGHQPDDVHTLVNLASLENPAGMIYAQAQAYLDQALALAPAA